MRKILFFALLLVSSFSFGQVKTLSGNGSYNIGTNRFNWLNGSDSLFRIQATQFKFFKPIEFTSNLTYASNINGSLGSLSLVPKGYVDSVVTKRVADSLVVIRDSLAALRSAISLTGLAMYDVVIRDSISTTNATPATLLTFTPNNDQGGFFEIKVAVMASDGTAAGVFNQSVRWRKTGGTITLGTVTSKHPDDLELAINAADINIISSSGSIVVQAVGIAATGLEWKCAAFVTSRTVFP